MRIKTTYITCAHCQYSALAEEFHRDGLCPGCQAIVIGCTCHSCKKPIPVRDLGEGNTCPYCKVFFKVTNIGPVENSLTAPQSLVKCSGCNLQIPSSSAVCPFCSQSRFGLIAYRMLLSIICISLPFTLYHYYPPGRPAFLLTVASGFAGLWGLGLAVGLVLDLLRPDRLPFPSATDESK